MNIAKNRSRYVKVLSKSLFAKTFMALLVISLSLVILTGLYTHFYVLKNLDTEIEKLERRKLNETISTMSMLFGEMKKLSINHAMNSNIVRFAYMPRDMISKRQQEVKNIQELFSSSINSSNYIRSIFVYYEKNDYVMDYSSPMNLSTYYDTGWHDLYMEMDASFNVLETRKVFDRNNPSRNIYNNIITFITKIPFDTDSKEGALLLNIDEKMVSDLLKNITYGDPSSLAFLVDREGTILSSNNEEYVFGNIKDLIDLPEIYMQESSGNFGLNIDNMKMISYFETFDYNEWRLFYIVSENKIFERSVYIKYLNIIIFSALLLLMILLSLIMSTRLYTPIKNIITNIKKTSPSADDNISDVSIIQNSIKTLLDNNRFLEQQLADNKVYMKEIYLNQLITGKMFNRKEILKRAEFFDYNLEYDFFKVSVLKYDALTINSLSIKELELQKLSIIHTTENVFKELNISADCSQDSDDNILILLKLHDTMDINEVDAIIEQALEETKKSIEDILGISVSVGIGRRYDDISNIGVSYKEAIEAASCRFIKDDDVVVSYADIIGSETEKLYYPADTEQKIISLVKLNDYDKAVTTLNDMIEDIMRHNKNFQHIETCLTNLSGIVKRCIFELNLNNEEEFKNDDSFTFSINNFKNVSRFSEWISSKLRLIIEFRIDQQKDHSKSFVNEVKEYIEENFRKELSLMSVAEQFKYSSSYFCKVFKEKTGTSFWEYVSTVRIEKSKELLAHTGNSIEQIAEMVGYNNRFSYIRTFKKQVGLTPGEFRSKMN